MQQRPLVSNGNRRSPPIFYYLDGRHNQGCHKGFFPYEKYPPMKNLSLVKFVLVAAALAANKGVENVSCP